MAEGFSGLNVRFDARERPYTGSELRPHFLLTELGMRGTSIAAFIGPCRVATEKLVDWEDRLANDRIEARSMVHFIGEFFGASLREGVLRQRLFMATLGQTLESLLGEKLGKHTPVLRDGDDLFISHRKLSVSIVTASPVSQLLHVGINIDPAGAPVPAIGLAELGLSSDDVREWVQGALRSVAGEWDSIEWACAKVRPVV